MLDTIIYIITKKFWNINIFIVNILINSILNFLHTGASCKKRVH